MLYLLLYVRAMLCKNSAVMYPFWLQSPQTPRVSTSGYGGLVASFPGSCAGKNLGTRLGWWLPGGWSSVVKALAAHVGRSGFNLQRLPIFHSTLANFSLHSYSLPKSLYQDDVMLHYCDAVSTVGPVCRNFKYRDVHVDGARVIAEASRAAGVKRLIHFSALNADANSPSRFLQSKVRVSLTPRLSCAPPLTSHPWLSLPPVFWSPYSST